MPDYHAPVDDMRFALRELFDTSALADIPELNEVDAELEDAILTEAGKFCSEVLQPLNGIGDAEGCEPTQVYYCPDMCHKVNVAQEASQSENSDAEGNSDNAPQPVEDNSGSEGN